MTVRPPDPTETAALKAAISAFLQQRLQLKIEKLKEEDADERERLTVGHLPANWLPDAARRAAQIQQVTHAIKFIHPLARGTDLYSEGNEHASELDVGTHLLGPELSADVVGNAAALDVYKFLSVVVEGRSLLQWAVERDAAFAAALSDDAATAEAWMSAFAALLEAKGKPASHKLAKQLYWPFGGEGYHLLAPLFPTSLVDRVWHTIREDRFSEEAKAAREAYRERRPHPHGFREYPNAAIQKFGGTKPQNVSQLNSERYGENWLLPSCPPTWRSDPVRPPLHVSSVFERLFGARREVWRLTKTLREFLDGVAEASNNVRIREARADIVARISDELLQFAAEIRDLDPGWSAKPECELNADEQCWLDPHRAESDESFAALCRRGDWQDGICLRFGNWLNARLKTDRLALGESEARHWQSVLDKELRMIRLELASHD